MLKCRLHQYTPVQCIVIQATRRIFEITRCRVPSSADTGCCVLEFARVNHSEVYGRCSNEINAFIRIRLSRLFTTLAVKTKKNIRLSKFKEIKVYEFNAVKNERNNTRNFTPRFLKALKNSERK